VFGCSGFCLIKGLDWSKIDTKKKKLTPLFLRHGEEDYNIRAVQGKATYDVMATKGVDHWEWDLELDVSRTYTESAMQKLSDFFHNNMKDNTDKEETKLDEGP
jgi:predicted esterase